MASKFAFGYFILYSFNVAYLSNVSRCSHYCDLGVVYINEAERKIPIAYAKRVRGNKMYGGVSSYLPLKVNQAGVIPIIFAISILLFPQFIWSNSC